MFAIPKRLTGVVSFLALVLVAPLRMTARADELAAASAPTVEQSNRRLTRLSGDRNTGFSVWNTVQMIASPTTTGSEPRSPERTRLKKAPSVPPIPAAWATRSSPRSSSGADSAFLPRSAVMGAGRPVRSAPHGGRPGG